MEVMLNKIAMCFTVFLNTENIWFGDKIKPLSGIMKKIWSHHPKRAEIQGGGVATRESLLKFLL